jgi:hypothetical protein
VKDGMGYCSNHSMKIVEIDGIDEFWPHYHLAICDDIRAYRKREEEKERKKIADSVMKNLNKDRRVYKRVRKK